MAIMLVPMISVFASDDYGLDSFGTPDTFEENAFVPAFDIWINQSVVPSMFKLMPWKYSTEDVARGWTLRHIIIAPPSVEWVRRSDFNVAEIINGGNFIIQGETNDPGYFGFSNRETEAKANYDLNELGTDDAGTVVTVNGDYIDDTSEPTASNLTMIAEEGDPLWACINYEAGDSKSITDYAREAAEADGGSLYEVKNATALGFAYDQFDALGGVQWNFDTPQAVSMSVDEDGQAVDGQAVYQAGVLKRVRIWLHKKKFERKTLSTTGGKWTNQYSAFKSISQATGLAQIPTGSKYYFSKAIGSAYFTKKTNVFASMNGIKKTVLGIIFAYLTFSTIVLIIVVILLIKYRKEIGKTLRSIFGK